MYSFLPQNIQSNISKEFLYVNEGMLVQMLDLLARVRNVCAHNERLYDYSYKKGTIDDTDIHRILQIKKKNGQYQKGKNDLFAVVIIFKYLLGEKEFVRFIGELDSEIEKLLGKTRCIQENQLLKRMGFPAEWKDIMECSKKV